MQEASQTFNEETLQTEQIQEEAEQIAQYGSRQVKKV